MDKEKQLELDIADTIIDRPKGFSVGRRHFYLYPVTLGKVYLQKRIVETLDINKELLIENPYAEALRLAESKKKECCLLLSYHTLQGKEEVLDNRKVQERKKYLEDNLGNEDLATLLITCLSDDKLSAYVRHFGIDKEQERMEEAAKAKDDSGTLTFGGKSIYGTLIDAACERYKWTFDYVVWGISIINLQLLLKDSVKTMYLTEDERKRVHTNDTSMIDGNSKESIMNAISSMNWG